MQRKNGRQRGFAPGSVPSALSVPGAAKTTPFIRHGSGHIALLKEVNKSKGDFPFGMVKAIVVFGNTKAIISSNKDFYHCIKSFQLSRETPASSGKDRDIMAQISIDTLNSKGILLASPIVNMLSRIYHIQISHISICAISAGFWCGIYDLLYPL